MNLKAFARVAVAVAMLSLPVRGLAADTAVDAARKIDAVLSDSARLKELKLDPADAKEIKTMRDEVLALEKAGDTEQAMALLRQALDLLGIE